MMDLRARALAKAIIVGVATDAWEWIVGVRRCAVCRKKTEGEYSIHRDGFGEGPEVPLCNECGSGEPPTCEEIWALIGRGSE